MHDIPIIYPEFTYFITFITITCYKDTSNLGIIFVFIIILMWGLMITTKDLEGELACPLL